jgi:hypothetical protein
VKQVNGNGRTGLKGVQTTGKKAEQEERSRRGTGIAFSWGMRATGKILRLFLKTALLLMVVLVLVCQLHEYGRLIVPIKEPMEYGGEVDHVEEALLDLGAPENKVGELADAVRNASRATNLPKELLVALVHTESSFRERAVSKKGYKGLMQIPQEIPYTDAHILVGARILEDKVRLAKGDIGAALAMYKGGKDKPMAQRYAAHTIRVYDKLRKNRKGGRGDGDER